jgi:hypothetical protein
MGTGWWVHERSIMLLHPCLLLRPAALPHPQFGLICGLGLLPRLNIPMHLYLSGCMCACMSPLLDRLV